jgi:hypothetical protein
MAPVRGTSAHLLIDEFDFSGETNSITISAEVSTLDPTNLASTGSEKIPNLPDGRIEHSGFHNGVGAGSIFQELYDRLGSATTAFVAVLLGDAGQPAVVLPATWANQLTMEAPVNDLITLAGAWPSNGAMQNGVLVYRGAVSATGAQTAVDFGAAGADGGFAYLFVQDITGTAASAAVKVQSATTQGGSYADEGTFTFSGVGVQTVAMTGTVNRWLRANVTSLGGATGFEIVCIAGLSGINFDVA